MRKIKFWLEKGGQAEIGHFSVTNNHNTAQEMGMDYRVGLRLPKTKTAHDN